MTFKQTRIYFRAEPRNPKKLGNSFINYDDAKKWAGKRGIITKVTTTIKTVERVIE